MKLRPFSKLGLTLFLFMLSGTFTSWGQSNELAATLEVLSPGVEVLRINTTNPIPVSVEAIVGVGDTIYTREGGHARITFFADGISTEILPNSEIKIADFNGSSEAFNLNVEVVIGQTLQQIQRVLDSNSSYQITTPGMTLSARGTAFAIRVEDTGRAGMIVTEGIVNADNPASEGDVESGFGVRAPKDQPLSDIVRASSFDELDSALDGCTITVPSIDDVSLNLRLGPSIDANRVGTIDPDTINIAYGVSESGTWYRTPLDNGYAWYLSSEARISDDCAGLRVFPDNHLEDSTLFENVGISTPQPESAPETNTEGDS